MLKSTPEVLKSSLILSLENIPRSQKSLQDQKNAILIVKITNPTLPTAPHYLVLRSKSRLFRYQKTGLDLKKHRLDQKGPHNRDQESTNQKSKPPIYPTATPYLDRDKGFERLSSIDQKHLKPTLF